MSLKTTFFLLICFALGIDSASACSYAYQYSLFPLGSSAGEIVFLEVELERYVSTPAELIMYGGNLGNNSIETRWKGNLNLKKSSDGHSFKLIENIAFVDIADANYNASLKPYFSRAMELAEDLPFFTEAVLLSYASCAYDRSCNFFVMELDSSESALFCKETNSSEERLKVNFPEILIKKFETVHKLNQLETEEQETLRKDFLKVWKPCSVRIYNIGGRKLNVYCIGWGQKKGYNAKKDESLKSFDEPVENYIEGNDVMMHGQRFDLCHLF